MARCGAKSNANPKKTAKKCPNKRPKTGQKKKTAKKCPNKKKTASTGSGAGQPSTGAGRRAPEHGSIQEFWAKTIRNGKTPSAFTRDVKVLRHGVPMKWRVLPTGVCAVLFVRDGRHYLAMVSAENLDKIKGTLGTGQDMVAMSSHAKTLRWGLRKLGNPFRVVDACYGFWFTVSKEGKH